MTSPEQPRATVIEPSAFEPLSADTPGPRGGGHPVRWLLLACGLLFLLIMAFLFTARSLQILVTADAPADIDIDGLAIPVGERYLVRSGEYALRVSAAGYYPHEQQLLVGPESSQQVTVELAPLPGVLELNSTPEGATVLIDGTVVGTTPLAGLPVAAGDHQLQLQSPRYQPLSQPLQITGREIRQQLNLELAPAWAEYRVASKPSGATIVVDGEAVGTTPDTIELMEGERQLSLQLPAYASWQQSVEVIAGDARELPMVALLPAAGALSLVSRPSGANVTLDGEFQGQTPLTLELSPGSSHRLALSRPGYRRHNESVQLAAGERADKSVTLQAQLGELRITVSPANAEVRVNGKLIGTGSQTLSLPAYEHSVEVSLPGYASVRQRVTPRPGLQQRVAAELQTEQAAKLARLQEEITSAAGQTLKLFIPGEDGRSDFTMGASRRDSGRRANEVLHPVVLRRMFYLQTTEVTNAQFRLFQANHNSGQIEGNSLNREHQPVAQVSWQQAAAFCNWLSEREELPPFYQQSNGIVTGFNPQATGYRLPTEAEWSWAARVEGDQLLKFPWGEQFPPTDAVENYADNTSAYVTGRILNGYTDGHVVSAPVASFRPNSKGLHDLGGNVAEWVHDVYQIPAANSGSQTDPLGLQSGDNFVIRGASWALSKLSELRLSYRDYGQAGRDDVGFRVARYAE